MKDLRDAILLVFGSAWREYDELHDQFYYRVDETLLKNLQAEYNIHFVEPDAQQLDVLQ